MAGRTGDFPPLTPQALTELLEDAVVSREWRPGDKLPSERRLAERYGVSRPVVREVLRRLQERGLIVVHPGRGSYVRRLRATEGGTSLELLVRRGDVRVRELVAARRMLETETAALAADQHTEEDARRMRDALAAFDAGRGVAAGADLDVAFHEAIAIASGNTVLQLMFGAIRPLTHGMVVRSLTDRETRRIGAPVHHDILAGILARKAEDAREAMARHIELAEELYGADLDRPLREVLQRRADHEPEVAALLERITGALHPPGDAPR
ncbi:FadR/GntR family transcriptional regulator [Streptomonospora litoralis]|uniref:HTH-type transcriptional regulator LutR n=1 Tax=Streptomonospora litoralis TaxID=2498135 RepID=A0A4P6Q5E5_9ACTN|nr:FadR/GntR family transcriptional regulator [Streptomonospora litoralis]QBI54571.1 HTH-type transcriptional regulator LutR [Streptomonospora litoralis]